MPIDRAELAARLRTLPLISNPELADDEDGAPLPDPFIAITEAERDALLAALGAEAEPRGWPPELKELYDATTILQSVLTFTHDSEGLLSGEMDHACRLLMTVRDRVRRFYGIEIDTPAALIKPVEIPWKFAARRLPSPPSSGREEQEA